MADAVQSRRDQVQAHMFVMGRLTTGVLRLEPDGLDQPVGRTTRGGMAGLVVGLLIGVGVALYGFIVPGGNTGWQKPGTLVVVKDSGARYLSVGGVLHPVLNLASAKLLVNGSMSVANVTAKSIRQAPRGAPFGLIGAPDSLPAATALTSTSWIACSTQVRDDTGAVSARLALAIGQTPAATLLGAGQSVVVAAPDGNDYLLWDGERLRLERPDDVLQAGGSAGAAPPAVSASFLDTVPAGPDLAVPKTMGAGTAGPVLGGQPTRLGQLFADGSGNRYLLTQQGLVALTPTLYALLAADPLTQSLAYSGAGIQVRAIGPDDLASHLAPRSATTALTHDGALPVRLPAIEQVSLRQAICEQIHPGAAEAATSLMIVDAGVLPGAVPDSEPGVRPSCLPADSISVKPGAGALVNASLAGGGVGAAYYLVTDGGVKYPVPSSDALTALGYDAVSPVVLPVNWLNLLPTGPMLTPGAVTGPGPVPVSAPGCGPS